MTHDNIDILVVDDDISHCTILQALLRGWGYNVALANSGRQALEQVAVVAVVAARLQPPGRQVRQRQQLLPPT